MSFRAVKFAFFRHVALPLGYIPFRILVATWKKTHPPIEDIKRLVGERRFVIATYHGMLLHLLAFSPLLEQCGVKMTAFVSPSKDGQLMADLLTKLGVAAVRGSSNSRAIGGASEFVRNLRDGRCGLVTVDGPRGPACVAKPGVLRLAETAEMPVVLVATTASSGISFGSWDRAHMPWPFARVELHMQQLELPADAPETHPEILQRDLLALTKSIDSPVAKPRKK